MLRTPLVLALTVTLGSTMVQAQTAQDLIDDASTPGDVLTYGMGYGQQRYSPLDQVNTDTVSGLAPVWAYSLDDGRGQESFPLVHDGVMYLTTHKSTMAVDAKSGKQIWKSGVEYPAETPRVACCGIVNRGLAMMDGKLFRTTLDANVIALDAATGEEIWRTNSIDFKSGYSFTVAPLLADGVLIVGISGGEYGIRGYIEGYDPETGDRLWRTYTVPAPGEPGSETWPEGDAWERGGGPAWLTGTYDPELNTVYWGTGNAGPWNAGVRPGDNLFTTSILALDPKSGEIKWHYQTTPNDPFDYDATNELVLAELDGQKVVMQANRNGFFYVLNRETGDLVAANKFVDRVDWADSIDLETGKPQETAVADGARSGEEVEFWPSAFGGKNWSPMSYRSRSADGIHQHAQHRHELQGGGAAIPGRRVLFRGRVQLVLAGDEPRLPPGHRSDERGGEVGSRHRNPAVCRNARNRRGPGLHRRPDRRIRGLQLRNRRQAVVVQHRLGHRGSTDDVGDGRQTICLDRERRRGGLHALFRRRTPRELPDRWVSLDLRAAGLTGVPCVFQS